MSGGDDGAGRTTRLAGLPAGARAHAGPAEDGFDEEADALDAWVEEYLEGRLSPEETGRFERALLEPAVAEAFREALVLRELLASLPPDAPPEALVSRIELALAVSGTEARRKAGRFPRLSAALGGASWALRGPALAVGTVGASVGSSRELSAATGNMRYAIAPVTALRGREGAGEAAPPARGKPLWRRVLGRAMRRGRKKGER